MTQNSTPKLSLDAARFLCRLAPIFILASMPACSPLQTPFDTPEKAAHEFHKKLLLNDCKGAFALLSEDTRKRLSDAAKSAADKAGALPKSPEVMICQGDTALYGSRELSGDDAVQVRLIQAPEGEQQDKAVVGVTIAGKEWPTQLIKEADGKWHVHLDSLFHNEAGAEK